MKPDIHLKEMSTHRMKHELYVTMWVNGPKGGSRGLVRFDRAEADKLLKQLARACAYLEEQANAALYASDFRSRDPKPRSPRRKRK